MTSGALQVGVLWGADGGVCQTAQKTPYLFVGDRHCFMSDFYCSPMGNLALMKPVASCGYVKLNSKGGHGFGILPHQAECS